MQNLPKVKKGFGPSLTRQEKIRKTVLGLALAVGMSAGAAASLPATANATVPSVTPTSNDREPSCSSSSPRNRAGSKWRIIIRTCLTARTSPMSRIFESILGLQVTEGQQSEVTTPSNQESMS